MANGNSWAVTTRAPSVPGSARHTNTTRAKKGPGQTVVRAPTPPIRYELKTKRQQRDQSFAIVQRGSNHQAPFPTHPDRSSNKRTPPARRLSYSNFTMTTTTTTTATSRVEEPSELLVDDEGNDDNMSLISMTGMIADDVCQMHNFLCDNIGPDNKKNANKSAIIDMDVSVMNSESKSRSDNRRRGRQRTKKPMGVDANPIKSDSFAVWDNQPRSAAGYGTPDTGSMNSGLSQSPEGHRTKSSSQMEVQVIDDSDNISEITPTGCVGFEGKKTQHRRNASRSRKNRTTGRSQESSLHPDEFHELLESVSKCLPTSDDVREIRRSCSDAQIRFDKKGTLLDPDFCDSYNSDGESQSYSHRYGNNDNGPVRSTSIVSAPAVPVFKNNLDRYNQLVVGRIKNDTPPTIERQRRIFTPGWFKSKRHVNKRRNNTRIIPPQGAPDVRYTSHQKRPAAVDEIHGNVNFEVLWKQSKSFKNHKKFLSSNDPVLSEALSKKPQSRTPILKKLLTRGKSKERKLHQEAERETQPVRSVSITAKDPTRWRPEIDHPQADSCEAAGIEGATECFSSSFEAPAALCNADTTMFGATSASNKGRSNRRSASRRGTQDPMIKGRSHKSVVTRTSNAPSRKNSGPVWRGDQDPDFQPRWPNGVPAQHVLSSPPQETNTTKDSLTRKNRTRCYHRNSEAIDLGDGNSSPAMEWTESRSYEEDDCGQEDIKVLSILGHHSSEQAHRSSSNDADPPFSSRHQQHLAQQPQRRLRSSPASRGKHSDRSSSAYYSTTSASSSTSSSYFSSSSSSPRQTPFQFQSIKTPDHNKLHPPGMSLTDAAFAAVFSSSSSPLGNLVGHGGDGNDDDITSGAIHSPWKKDYNAYVSSRKNTTKGNIPREPTTPPRIQRSSDPHASFDATPKHENNSNKKKESSSQRVGIPRQP
jgi:hypothetical protein